MARINLLPWREELRLKRQNEFVAMIAGTALFMGLVMFGVHAQIETEKSSQEARNKYLKEQIAAVDSQIKEISLIEKKKQSLISRMDVIQTLQSSRPKIVHVFDEIAKVVPEGIYLYDISQKGDKFVLTGKAESSARVSSLIRNIKASEWLVKPDLGVIDRGKAEEKLSSFTVTFESFDKSSADAKKAKQNGGA
ncbi:MAG: PilN domain-containing protein [Methylococcales bacterium]|jgi:type IV pilus assembly protein PilN|nr:PilN domain-containing protein [Methylococcales bacterium]MBT7443563.1 PilN domain-containing protein [Methylococcales bacterium]